MSLTHNIIAGVLRVDRKDGGAMIMKITMNSSVNLTMVVVVLKEGALPCPPLAWTTVVIPFSTSFCRAKGTARWRYYEEARIF